MNDNSNKQEIEDELYVLSSIYTKNEFVCDEDLSGGKFFSFVNLPPDFVICYKNYKKETANQFIKIPIVHLPPITFTFKCPSNYPVKVKPDFQISCPWLSITKLNKICEKLDSLWEENHGTVILYIWTQFLCEEVLQYVGIKNNLDLTRRYRSELRKHGLYLPRGTIKQAPCDLEENNLSNESRHIVNVYKMNAPMQLHLPIGKDPRILTVPIVYMHLHQYLMDFNEEKLKAIFLETSFSCGICFQDKVGEHCLQFKPCQHVYCRECIGGYFEVRIKDNMVESMPCPTEKCKSEAFQSQIKEVVGNLLFSKYDTLLLNATLDRMSDITYCPRLNCGCPVMLDTEESMAECPKCCYVFCILCKMTYHGIAPCRIKNEEKRILVDEYESGDAATKARLEKRYGKKQITNFIQNFQSENWIETNSKLCPNCNAAIEKSDGCNKMACLKCKAFFCWICLVCLDRNAPYKHYEDHTSKCYNQLFQGVIFNIDEEDDGPQGFYDLEDYDDADYIDYFDDDEYDVEFDDIQA